MNPEERARGLRPSQIFFSAYKPVPRVAVSHLARGVMIRRRVRWVEPAANLVSKAVVYPCSAGRNRGSERSLGKLTSRCFRYLQAPRTGRDRADRLIQHSPQLLHRITRRIGLGPEERFDVSDCRSSDVSDRVGQPFASGPHQDASA